MEPWSVAIFGVMGAAIAEFAVWFRFRRTPKADLPEWFTSVRYWIASVFAIFLGGLFAWAGLEGKDVSVFVVIQVGASTPLILQQLADGGALSLSAGTSN
ncbi:hypothetical protein ASF37_11660 [Aeromicrobium sp. Leaf289]|nr:hypothetical protein ASF37_11660 [Aeromicrobium sp. Leaf289]